MFRYAAPRPRQIMSVNEGRRMETAVHRLQIQLSMLTTFRIPLGTLANRLGVTHRHPKTLARPGLPPRALLSYHRHRRVHVLEFPSREY